MLDVHLTVQGEKWCRGAGPLGSDESALFNVTGCSTERSRKTMQCDGEPVYDEPWLRSDVRRLRLFKIDFIFRTHDLVSFLDGTENVAEAMEFADVHPHEMRTRAPGRSTPSASASAHLPAPRNSWGEEARSAAIAHVLADRRRIVPAGEPTDQLVRRMDVRRFPTALTASCPRMNTTTNDTAAVQRSPRSAAYRQRKRDHLSPKAFAASAA